MAGIGYATLSVIPSAKGFGSKLSSGIGPELDRAGRDGGKRFGAGMSSSARSIGGGAGKLLGVGLLGGLGVAMAGIGAIIHTGFGEAMDASAGTAQLAAGIKSTGGAANVSVKGLNALAGSIQGYSGQTDDSIVASEKLLLTFTNIKNSGSDKIFDQATVATANMAAKMGGDASGAAIQLGKALNDPVKGISALSRVGVSFSQGQKDSIAAMVKSGDTMGAQKVILGELNKEFGGAAAAAGKSLPGQLAIAKRSFEDVSQAVMEGILPVVVPALKGIADFATGTLVPGVQAMVAAFTAGGDDITSSGFAGVMERIGLAARKVVDFFKGTVIPGVQAMAAAFAAGGDDVTSSGFAGVMERIGLAARKIADWVTGSAIPAIQNFVGEFKNGTGPGGTFRSVVEKVGTVIGVTAIAVAKIIGWLKDHNGVVKAAALIVGILTVAVQAHNIAMFISTGGLRAWILQTTIVKAATAAWSAVQWILNAAMTANPIGLVVVAIAALVAGIIWVATKTTWFQTIWEYASHAIGAVWTWLWNTILQPVIHFILTGFASVAGAIGHILVALGNIPGFGWAKTAGTLMLGAATAATKLADGLHKIPKNVSTTYTANWSAATANIVSAMNRANKGGVGVGFNAVGTDNWHGGLTWVGEKGPEIVNLPRGSQVIPNDKTSAGPTSRSDGSADLLTELRGLRGDIQAMPKTYQMGQRQYA